MMSGDDDRCTTTIGERPHWERLQGQGKYSYHVNTSKDDLKKKRCGVIHAQLDIEW